MDLNADLIKFESDSEVSCAWSLSDSESDDSSANEEEEKEEEEEEEQEEKEKGEEKEEDEEEAPPVFGPRRMGFLDLPGELRNNIYEHLRASRPSPGDYLAFTGICRGIRVEFRSLCVEKGLEGKGLMIFPGSYVFWVW